MAKPNPAITRRHWLGWWRTIPPLARIGHGADIRLVVRAAAFAAAKHRHQRRKDRHASPYINHPLDLALLLTDECGVRDSTTIAAALLHDVLEDTQTGYQELRGEFGSAVTDIVIEVTDMRWLKKPLRKRLQVTRAAKASGPARLIKLADKVSNLRDLVRDAPPEWSLERRRDIFDRSRAVVDQIRGTNTRVEARFDQLYRQRP